MERYHNQGHSLWDTIGMGGRDWLQQSRESNMSLNHMLFETPIRLSVQSPIAETVQPTLNDLRQLPPYAEAIEPWLCRHQTESGACACEW
jgi:hypothetical protein